MMMNDNVVIVVVVVDDENNNNNDDDSFNSTHIFKIDPQRLIAVLVLAPSLLLYLLLSLLLLFADPVRGRYNRKSIL